MPILVCRKCGAKGTVKEITKLRYKNIVTVLCTSCKNGWHLSTLPSYDEFDLERINESQISYDRSKALSTDAHKKETEDVPETAMSIALAKVWKKE